MLNICNIPRMQWIYKTLCNDLVSSFQEYHLWQFRVCQSFFQSHICDDSTRASTHAAWWHWSLGSAFCGSGFDGTNESDKKTNVHALNFQVSILKVDAMPLCLCLCQLTELHLYASSFLFVWFEISITIIGAVKGSARSHVKSQETSKNQFMCRLDVFA